MVKTCKVIIKKLAILLIIIAFPLYATGQQSFTISGHVSDIDNGEDLIGVTIYSLENLSGTISNSYGFYSLSLPEGNYTIRFSYLGYESIDSLINLDGNRLLDIELKHSTINLEEVVVTSERRDINISEASMGVERLNVREIKYIPVIFGEKDVLKTIQLLPGISSSGEGSTGFNVRGGSMDQNLILLDEATVFSASHLMGFFSVFNSDALKDVIVYKGGIPARYGGRASSVLDISMNNGNSKHFSASGGIGLISTRLTLEAPLIKDKLSYIISGRRTYLDIIAKALFPDDIVDDDIRFYFYDLNTKINYTLNKKNRLFLSGYFGQDVFGLGSEIGTDWGNATGTLRWNHLFSDKLFSNTSLIYSKYNYSFNLGELSLKLGSGIEDYSIKEDATLYLNPDNTMKFGFSFTSHKFMPGELTSNMVNNFEIVLDEKRALESGIYFQNDHNISERLSSTYGIRVSMFNQTGPGWVYKYNDYNSLSDSVYIGSGEIAQSYFAVEPRLSVNYRLNQKSSIKLSYNRMAQYMHLLSNSTSGTPMDVWIPSSTNIKPVLVDQISIGYYRNFLDNGIESSIEIYYKGIDNATDYEDGAEIMLNKYVESVILTGRGRSYGVEFYLKKKYGDFTGWISYTLSRTENLIDGINNNSWYPLKYDKTHDVSVIASYQFSRRLFLSAVWIYATGNAVTFPSGKYELDGQLIPYYTERNGYRMPSYNRLDASLTLKSKKKRARFEGSWDFSIYNLYNRHNAYSISFRESETGPGNTEAVKLSLFGIVPSVSYNFKF